MAQKAYPFVGKADIYVAPILATEALTLAALVSVGNCLDAKISVKETTDKVPDMRLGASGTYASYSDIQEASLDLTLVDYSPENLAMALLGQATDIAGGTVTDEVIAFRHGLIRSAHIGISSVVVKSADGLTTYVLGTDYAVSGAGIIGLEGSALAEAAPLKLSYAYPAQHKIEMATVAAKEFLVLIDGANYALGGAPQVMECYRVKFGAGSGIDLISEKLAKLPLKGELLPDNSKQGAGISKYAKIVGVKPV